MIRPVLLLGLLLAGCSTYGTAIDEFDSIAGWSDPQTEPAVAKYPDIALQYTWYGWLMPGDPVDETVENPSGFARERIELLSEYVTGDLSTKAQVTRRLLWVAERDPSAFNRIQALTGIERTLRSLGADPLDLSAYTRELDPQQLQRQERALQQADATLRRLFARSTRPQLSVTERRDYVAALRAYTAEPVPRLRWQRDLIRTLWSSYVTETDPDVVDAATIALRRAIRFACCNGLRAALVPEDFQAADLPSVRREVLFIYRRLGGLGSLSFLLNMMVRPQAGSSLHRYDQDLSVRMALVRLCAQLRLEHAGAGPFGGARPIELLYVIAVDETEDDGLRRVALEGLARCLSEKLGFTTMPEGDAWAREWWKQDVVERRR